MSNRFSQSCCGVEVGSPIAIATISCIDTFKMPVYGLSSVHNVMKKESAWKTQSVVTPITLDTIR